MYYYTFTPRMIRPEEIEEECGYGSVHELPKDEVEQWTACVQNLSVQENEEVTVATFDSSDPRYFGGTPDERGTTGLKVSRSESRLVVDSGQFKQQQVNNISSDPALGPRIEVQDEQRINFAAASGKVYEAAVESQNRRVSFPVDHP